MQTFTVRPIGTIEITPEGMFLQLKTEYIPALQGLEGFSHLNVLWWFDQLDDERSRRVLEIPKPYQKAPAVLGTFATHSPQRPNPLALTTVEVVSIDSTAGRIQVAYIDAMDGTPILDLKPYTPSESRVETPAVPDWCAHWPQSVEGGEDFDWEGEFLFSGE